MNRKQHALENRYQKSSRMSHDKWVRQEVEREKAREDYIAKELWEQTRPCTEKDLIDYLDDWTRGWFAMSSSRFFQQPKWKIERDEIVNIAYRTAREVYARPVHLSPWEEDPEWVILVKTHVLKEWKRRQTKLYKVLR